MRNNSKLKVLTLIVMIVLIICSARVTFAATQITPIGTSNGSSANNTNMNGISTPGAGTNNISRPTNNTFTTPDNNTVTPNNVPNTVTNSSIPQAGAESTTMLFVLIGFATISTIYTYLKIKKYNI